MKSTFWVPILPMYTVYHRLTNSLYTMFFTMPILQEILTLLAVFSLFSVKSALQPI